MSTVSTSPGGMITRQQWEERSDNLKRCALDASVRRQLTQMTADLSETLSVNHNLCVQLESREVLGHEEIEEIQVIPINAAKVRKLLDILRHRSLWHYRGFVDCMRNTDNLHVLDKLPNYEQVADLGDSGTDDGQEIDPGDKSQQPGDQPDQSQPSLKRVEETLTDEGGLFTWTDLRQALPEYSVFCVLTKYIGRCLKKGQPLTERHDRMLREIVYTDMSDDELGQVMNWLDLPQNYCKSWGKILKALYDKRYSVSGDTLETNRYITVLGGWNGKAVYSSMMTAKVTSGGKLTKFKAMETSLSSPVYGASCVEHLGYMFLCGGCNLDDAVKTCSMYSPSKRQWSGLPAMVDGRAHFTLHALPSGRYIMAVGGLEKGLPHSECEQFDLVTQTWSRVRSLPAGRWYHAGVVCDDVLYVTGGDVGAPPFAATATVLVYDEALDKWQDAPPMLHPRVTHSAGTIPGSVVVCGGADWSSYYRNVMSVEKFDTATRQWTIISHLQLGHSFNPGVCLDNRLVLVGGKRHEGASQVAIFDTTIVDLTDGDVSMETRQLPKRLDLYQAATCVIDLPDKKP